ncbi:S9 family peptidase [Nitratireductor pacificus]|uniref:Oligopeptidase B n=1 Tax=Nitratireductor pacificus pht-3B TaxID=391937 RepID=K2N6K8_9HYPH|nr:S9 family peptidase [Nitratireductor pacificus]EKF19808.1 Oligopeptidase B [Nitratireductor pacificus pht-3B]
MPSKAFPSNIAAPLPEARPVTDTRHGVERSDEYAWMRADNWQEVLRDPSVLDGAIRTHLEAENAYQAELMRDTEALQKDLAAEMRSRIKEDETSVPSRDGPYAYAGGFRTGGEYPRFFRVPRDGGEEELLLDGDREAEGKSYFRLGGADHSPDHSQLLWGHDDMGSELYTLSIRDLATGRDLDDTVTETGGSGEWDAKGHGFFYARLDANHRPSSVFYHPVGANPAEDRLIYDETDPGFFVNVSGSRLHDWIYVSAHDHETSECHVIPAGDPSAAPRLVAAREAGLQYELEEGGDVFFILTNADDAKDFKIVSAPVADPARANWKDVVPHEPGRLILSVMAFARFLVRLERKDGLPRIIVRERASGDEHMIAFDEEAYSLGLHGSYEYETDTLRFSYSSMTTPEQVFDYDMGTRERTLLKTQEVPSGHNPEDYVTRRLMAPAPDGALVPISLVHRRGLALDGSAPCLLYGYGAYGMAMPASFNTNCLSLVDRGFVYAIAHIRGGKEKGYAWYEDGKREKKVNSFTDFIACARHLVAEGYTSHDRIVAEGGSAGGMLMGAVANLAPEAFGGIVAAVPFVDVLNTMLDDTLPLTPPEWPEWGNPITSKEDYDTIAAYSPYDNVAAHPYPPILALAGLTDPRVTYWEPAKWVARLRALGGSDNPVLFKTNLDAGHAGASGRFSRLDEKALTYAFVLKVTGKRDSR